MVYQPRSQEDIYTSVKGSLTGKIAKLTNFTTSSFNYVWTHDAFSDQFHEYEVALLYTQLATLPDYAGKTITNEDLEDINVDTDKVSASEINEYVEDQDLDELAKLVSVSRDPGDQATGTVTFTVTGSGVTIPEGTEVGTQPDGDGDFLSFTTDADVTSSGSTVNANITAEAAGTEYNVGSGTVTYLPDGVTGVTSVTNSSSITGGEDEETNSELRTRMKDAINASSGGGTTAGIEGYIQANVDGVGDGDVIVDEFFDPSTPTDKQDSPYADVIVDGGTDSEINDAIDTAHPSAVKHYLVRPTTFSIRVEADVTGTAVDIDNSAVETDITDFLDDLALGEDLFRDKVIQTIMNSDNDITNIDSLTIQIIDEEHTYDSDNSGGDAPNHPLYKLDKGDQMAAEGIVEVTGTFSSSSGHTFVDDTDYQEGTVDGGSVDAIDWGLSGDNPDEDTSFFVDYNIDNDLTIANREKVESDSASVTVV